MSDRYWRKKAVAAWVEENGEICPGWGRVPHPSGDLTADHIVPRSQGGEGGAVQVLCRSCNSRRGTRKHANPVAPLAKGPEFPNVLS
ncbi:MAG: HNH endonuclease [Gemmatimonadetes bacterium]|nr:HNH endonuclease [Gemmatimonadota bacterium]